jgi:hypothetical protein
VIKKSLPSVYVSVRVPHIVVRQRLGKNLPIVARQRLRRYVTAATNTHPIIEEKLDVSFSMWPLSYQEELLVIFSSHLLLGLRGSLFPSGFHT